MHTFGSEVKQFLREAALFLVPNFNIIESWIWSVRDAIIELANPQIGPQGTSLGNTKCVFRSMESSIRAHASIPGPYQGRHD